MSGFWGFDDCGEQAWMLLDRVRNEAYASALKRLVNEDSVVLDIGTGTGIWALLAARSGAKMVYAVERGTVAEAAKAHARENGLQDKVKVLRADFMDLTSADFPMTPTIVTGEVLGHFAPDEHQHRLYQRAKAIAPNAVFIPGRYRIVLAAVHPVAMDKELHALRELAGIHLAYLTRKLLARPSLARLEPEELMSDESEGPWISSNATLPASFGATVTATRAGAVSGISAGFAAELAPDVVLRTAITSPKTVWGQTVFPLIRPLECQAGDELTIEIQPRLISRRDTYTWTIRNGDETSGGDAMQALMGNKQDLLQDLGLRPKTAAAVKESAKLKAWITMLQGTAQTDINAMAQRLHQAYPDRYADMADCRQEVLDMLQVANALG